MNKLILSGMALFVFLSACDSSERTKRNINLKDYKGAVIVGRQYNWEGDDIGSELVTFRKKDSLWTETFMKSVFHSYNVGDTIK